MANEEESTTGVVIMDNDVADHEVTALVEVEKAAAMQRVQAQYVIAKRFPRNQQAAVERISQACKRKSLAAISLYRYPRGGKTVEGISIRLAEEIARSWGNLDFGIRELEQVEGLNGRSVVESYCTDLETNVHQSRTFTVFHKRKVGEGNKATMRVLTDPRDVYEHVANYGARRMRAAILGIIPRDIQDMAIAGVKATMRAGDSEPLVDKVNRMVAAFAEISVSVEMLERRLQHAAKDISLDELDELRGIYQCLKDGESSRDEFFQLASEPEGGAAAALNDRAAKKVPVKK